MSVGQVSELERAVGALRVALSAALDDAHAETSALERFATAELPDLTSRRADFNLQSASRIAQLEQALPPGPHPAAVAEALAEIHDLSRRLGQIDLLNQRLAQQALRFTRAYLDALLPRSRAYDRRGLATPLAPALTTVSHRS